MAAVAPTAVACNDFLLVSPWGAVTWISGRGLSPMCSACILRSMRALSIASRETVYTALPCQQETDDNTNTYSRRVPI